MLLVRRGQVLGNSIKTSLTALGGSSHLTRARLRGRTPRADRDSHTGAHHPKTVETGRSRSSCCPCFTWYTRRRDRYSWLNTD